MALTRKTRIARGLVLVVGLALVGGCSTDPAQRSAATAATAEVSPAGSGSRQAPEFTLQDVDGSSVSLADSAGQVRLIDFWTTWCPPCRDEIPMLKELHETYGEQGLTILAISDENAKVVRDFVEDHEIPYTNLIDTEEVSAQYVVLGLPTAYLLDGEGKIVESFLGPKPRKPLEGKIRELLELPPST